MPKSLRTAFPERVPMAGGLNLLATSADGAVIAARPFGNGRDPSPDISIVTRGSKKPTKVRLDTAGLFPTDTVGPAVTGLALVTIEAKTALLATWDDQGRDGAGVGVFDLEGKPRVIHWQLDEAQRQQRLRKQGSGVVSMSGSAGMTRELCVSGDGQVFAFRIGAEVHLWELATLLHGGGAAQVAELPGRGLAVDADHRALTVFANEHGNRFNRLAVDGTSTRVELQLSDSLGIRVWAVNDMIVTGNGQIFDASGDLRGRLPSEAWSASATDDALVLIGGTRADPRLWILDAASLDMRHDEPAAGATSATRVAAIGGQHIAVGGKNCLRVLVWPLADDLG